MENGRLEKRSTSSTAARPAPTFHNRKTGLYLYGNLYIADEFMLECRTL